MGKVSDVGARDRPTDGNRANDRTLFAHSVLWCIGVYIDCYTARIAHCECIAN